MGASGAGKSLFLRAIADLDPNDGEALVDGTARSKMPAFEWRRRVALVPAESGWWADNVVEHFVPGLADTTMLEALGVPADALGWAVSRLSSGERHRLAIIRALSRKPKAILLDEPSASLDAKSTTLLESVLRDELARGTAILLITHDPAQADRLARRTLMMADGRIAEGQGVAK